MDRYLKRDDIHQKGYDYHAHFILLYFFFHKDIPISSKKDKEDNLKVDTHLYHGRTRRGESLFAKSPVSTLIYIRRRRKLQQKL